MCTSHRDSRVLSLWWHKKCMIKWHTKANTKYYEEQQVEEEGEKRSCKKKYEKATKQGLGSLLGRLTWRGMSFSVDLPCCPWFTATLQEWQVKVALSTVKARSSDTLRANKLTMPSISTGKECRMVRSNSSWPEMLLCCYYDHQTATRRQDPSVAGTSNLCTVQRSTDTRGPLFVIGAPICPSCWWSDKSLVFLPFLLIHGTRTHQVAMVKWQRCREETRIKYKMSMGGGQVSVDIWAMESMDRDHPGCCWQWHPRLLLTCGQFNLHQINTPTLAPAKKVNKNTKGWQGHWNGCN